MLQIHLVMTNNTIVKVGHIERSVGAKCQIDRAKPPIIAGEKLGRFFNPW
jgi:hypothetical protein